MSLIERTAIIGRQTLVELNMPRRIYDHGRKFFLPAGPLRGPDVKTKAPESTGRLLNEIDLIEILERKSIDVTCPEQLSLPEQIARTP